MYVYTHAYTPTHICAHAHTWICTYIHTKSKINKLKTTILRVQYYGMCFLVTWYAEDRRFTQGFQVTVGNIMRLVSKIKPQKDRQNKKAGMVVHLYNACTQEAVQEN